MPTNSFCRTSFPTRFASLASGPLVATLAILTTVCLPSVQAAEPPPIELAAGDATSLRKALAEIRGDRARGDQQAKTLQLPAGRYRFAEPLRLDPATVGNGLTLRAAEPGRVVFTSGLALPSRGRDGAGNWRFALPNGWQQTGIPRLVLRGGNLQAAARHPNQGTFRIAAALPDRRSGFTTQADDLPADLDVAAAPCDLVLLHDWSSSRLPVASYEAATRTLRTVGPIGCEASHYAIDHFEKQPRYWLEGHPAFADRPGEWYIDAEAAELIMVASPDQASPPVVELPQRTRLLEATGTPEQPLQGLVLEGIEFTGTRFPMPPGGLAGAQATMHEPRDAQGNRTTGDRPFLSAAVDLQIAHRCAVRRCRFRGLGNTGLRIGRQAVDCEVDACRFDDIGGNALNVGEDNNRQVRGAPWYQQAPEQVPTDNRVVGCEISRCGQVLPGAVAIWGGLHRRLEVADNHLHDCPYTGISLGWIWDDRPSPAEANDVHHNHIEYVMQVLSDGGGIYTLGRQPESELHHNQITDIPLNAGRAESNGMFLDQGSAGLTIHHNTCRRIDKSPLRFHQAKQNTVRDNRWTLGEGVPPVRFNNTPAENIAIRDNEVLAPQTKIFLIGNSLTWDTIPSRLDGHVEWHVDCGKSLQEIANHPESPCVASSVPWPRALRRSQFDVLVVQPHYGTSLEEDLAVISDWVRAQPTARLVLHSGWARQATRAEEYAHETATGTMTHSAGYLKALREGLQERFPDRRIDATRTTVLLARIAADITAGEAPLEDLASLYRDPIHMTHQRGRYLMHNAMRQALGQPLSEVGFPDVDPAWQAYVHGLLDAGVTGSN